MTALVTGAGRGIGRAIAVALGAEGHEVLVADVDGPAAERVAAEVGGRALVLDVADPAAVTAALAGLADLAVLVNNAGVVGRGPLGSVAPEDYRRVMDVNVLGPLLVTQACTEALAAGGGGAVVNVASMSATVPVPGTGVYPASKAALVALTRGWALELAPRGVRVNAVAPGRIATEMSAERRRDPEVERRTDALLPLGRTGEGPDVADVVCFLASDRARYVTGQTLHVDGGLTLGTIPFFARAQRG